MSSDEALCIEAGMDGYIAKPFRATKLQSVLNNISEQLRSGHAPMPTASEQISAGELDAFFASLSEEDREDLLAAAEIFLKNYEADWQRLQQAWERGEFSELNHRAHSIKGGASIFQAERLRNLSESLEYAALNGEAENISQFMPALELELKHFAELLRAHLRKHKV
ncbi:MAG: response regulator [Verrucomicrobiota bacterium]